jgi:hypothetical protein
LRQRETPRPGLWRGFSHRREFTVKYFSSQLGELGVAYLLAAAGMLVALIVTRADRRAYFRWPVYSAMTLALGVICWNLLRKHVFPAEWLVGYSSVLYWSALAMYVVLGLLLGLLLGRITRARRVDNEVRKEGDQNEHP